MHPTFKQSGDGTWAARLSKMGRSSVRWLLYMPALAAIRSNDILKLFMLSKEQKAKNIARQYV